MSKKYLIPVLLFPFFLTACGQKGALYLPKQTNSEIPTADNSNNPNDLNNVQNPSQITPAINSANPNTFSQNPNIKIQDTKHDY